MHSKKALLLTLFSMFTSHAAYWPFATYREGQHHIANYQASGGFPANMNASLKIPNAADRIAASVASCNVESSYNGYDASLKRNVSSNEVLGAFVVMESLPLLYLAYKYIRTCHRRNSRIRALEKERDDIVKDLYRPRTAALQSLTNGLGVEEDQAENKTILSFMKEQSDRTAQLDNAATKIVEEYRARITRASFPDATGVDYHRNEEQKAMATGLASAIPIAILITCTGVYCITMMKQFGHTYHVGSNSMLLNTLLGKYNIQR